MSALHKAEHVGSFLRPKAVLEAREKHASGQLDAAGLRKIEDEHIAQLVADQLKHGLKSISDGEYRREYFHLDHCQHYDGITVVEDKLVEKDANDAKPPRLAVTGKIRHSKPIEVENYRFVQSELDKQGASKNAVVKVAIPSPTMVHFRGGRGGIDSTAYPELDAFFEDLAAAWRAEIKDLADAGCTFVQLDDTNLAYLCDLKMREAAAGRGENLDTLPRQYCKLINESLRDRPKNMTVAIHLCRGNFRSTHFAEGGYEPIAKVLFEELDVDAYYLEFDDDRSGDFKPLRFLPKGKKVVVLGIISTKFPKLEDKDFLAKRIKEAAQYAPLEQLAISGQCGFSSTKHGNNLTMDEQWRKVDLFVETANTVWGKQ